MEKKLKINTFLKIPNTWTAEIVGNIGFDFITIDMQHGLIDYHTMLLMLQSLKSSTSKILVRSPWNEPSILMRILDAGASGIICPMINSAEEASSLVQACQYPPDGNRSFGPIRAKFVGTYSTLQQTNQEVLTFAMIETKEAIENLEAIASTKNLHGLYIGPSDLSISLGLMKIADFNDNNLVSVLKNVITIAKKYQLTTATQVYDVEQAKIAKALGFDIVTPIDDSALFENVMKEKMEIIKRDLL
jgi:4-hydroxy-2-oxoheptanedioate aldolase